MSIYLGTQRIAGLGGSDLTSITGYDANAPLQRLVNLSGSQKWQTRSVSYTGFNGSTRYIEMPNALPSTISSIDCIMQVYNNGTISNNAQDFFVGNLGAGESLYWKNTNDGWKLGCWTASNVETLYDGANLNAGTDVFWFRIKGTGTNNLYFLADNSRTYTPETLPALSSWTNLGTCDITFANSKFGFGCRGSGYCVSLTAYNLVIYANDTKVFDMRTDDFVSNSSEIVKNESWS